MKTKVEPLYTGPEIYDDLGLPTAISNNFSKRLDALGMPLTSGYRPSYHTALRNEHGKWYVTNKYDPMVRKHMEEQERQIFNLREREQL